MRPSRTTRIYNIAWRSSLAELVCFSGEVCGLSAPSEAGHGRVQWILAGLLLCNVRLSFLLHATLPGLLLTQLLLLIAQCISTRPYRTLTGVLYEPLQLQCRQKVPL